MSSLIQQIRDRSNNSDRPEDKVPASSNSACESGGSEKLKMTTIRLKGEQKEYISTLCLRKDISLACLVQAVIELIQNPVNSTWTDLLFQKAFEIKEKRRVAANAKYLSTRIKNSGDR